MVANVVVPPRSKPSPKSVAPSPTEQSMLAVVATTNRWDNVSRTETPHMPRTESPVLKTSRPASESMLTETNMMMALGGKRIHTTPASPPLSRKQKKKQKTEKLEEGLELANRDVAGALANLQSFVALSSEGQAQVLASMTSQGRVESAIVGNIAATVSAYARDRSEDARRFRMALASSILSHEEQQTVSHRALLYRIGLHGDTIKRVIDLHKGCSVSQLATMVMQSTRARRKDVKDFEGSPLKTLCLHYMFSTTRDSPNPDDCTLIRKYDRFMQISNRYLNVKKGEAYFNFVRDLCRAFLYQNPSKSVSDCPTIGKSLFLKWLREWKFFKTEHWHVCICALCFNMEQFVTVYTKITRRVHGQPKGVTEAPAIPLRTKPVTEVKSSFPDFEVCDSDEDSDVASAFRPVHAECKSLDCMRAPFRKPTLVDLPANGSYLQIGHFHSFLQCFYWGLIKKSSNRRIC